MLIFLQLNHKAHKIIQKKHQGKKKEESLVSDSWAFTELSLCRNQLRWCSILRVASYLHPLSVRVSLPLP
jgi:hypothetical protein